MNRKSDLCILCFNALDKTYEIPDQNCDTIRKWITITNPTRVALDSLRVLHRMSSVAVFFSRRGSEQRFAHANPSQPKNFSVTQCHYGPP